MFGVFNIVFFFHSCLHSKFSSLGLQSRAPQYDIINILLYPTKFSSSIYGYNDQLNKPLTNLFYIAKRLYNHNYYNTFLPLFLGVMIASTVQLQLFLSDMPVAREKRLCFIHLSKNEYIYSH